jgi:phosphoribosylformylglycinamidine synthase
MQKISHFYKKVSTDFEYCFNIKTDTDLSSQELKTLRWLLSDTYDPDNLSEKPFLSPENSIVEIGPRLNFETADSSNAVSICRSCGLEKVTRVELSRRYKLDSGINRNEFIAGNHDRMTEQVYPEPIKSFELGKVPEKTYFVPLTNNGIDELARYNKEKGLGMDGWDLQFYFDLFVNFLKRDPTNVELFMLGTNNSEHARHWFFKGKLIIDGVQVPHTLMQIIKAPWQANPSNSVLAFCDNSSAIRGYTIRTIIPKRPGISSPLVDSTVDYDITFTAETHNYPSGIQPFQGATTGTGGRIRDGQATGRGSLVIAGTAGYCTAALNIPGYDIPGEPKGLVYPYELATPLDILIQASNGASDYGNKFGEPIIQGFVRTFEQVLPDKERRAWLKPIMFTGGVGQLDRNHLKKLKPEKGMIIVEVGGPAYRIGIGGGSASSMIQGENIAELDFNAVQRGNPEMENKVNRVFRACVEMGDKNPFLVVHDQGAGGPGNVLSELMDPAGGIIKIRNIKLGDPSLSVMEILCSEYQERNAFLVKPEAVDDLLVLCKKEKVNCEVLGEITGDGRLVVYDDTNKSRDVDLPLDRILGEMPQKPFKDERIPRKLEPINLPSDLTVEKAVKMIFRLPSVGSKGFLVRKVDRAVTGLIAQQQCCGPLHLPVADVAVVAQSHFGLTGAAIAIGEQPIKMLIDDQAGARMSIGEMLTNIVSARITDISHIKCSINWMWAAKLPGEGTRIYDAASAVGGMMTALGIAGDGGKDSVSMAAKAGGENVKAPGSAVISAYASMDDVTRKVTPDIKKPGESKLLFIELGEGRNRMGGSALAQALGQLGDECPDVDDPLMLKFAFNAVQKMIDENLILACHDRSDGGMVTTLAEMAMSGNCGIIVELPEDADPIPYLFSEELGLVLEYLPADESRIVALLKESDLPYQILGNTEKERRVYIKQGTAAVLDVTTPALLSWWELTSDRLEEEQMNPEVARMLARHHDRPGISYHLTYTPEETPKKAMESADKPKIAVIRDEGSNGDREMSSAFYTAGFEPWDVSVMDLLNKAVSLDQFRGIVFVGGFAHADVLGPGKGWAGTIRFNDNLRNEFDRFYRRKDTFSLGVCNGFQLMSLLDVLTRKGIPEQEQPALVQNASRRFESHWGTVKIYDSPAIMLKGMSGSVLGIWSDHGGGRMHFPDKKVMEEIRNQKLTPVAYVDDNFNPTEEYRFNPNGSPSGIISLCSPDGRHLAMMPHPERAFLLWQWPYLPNDWKQNVAVSPWLKMFQNAREWCEQNKG